jgi:hypothetical protein
VIVSIENHCNKAHQTRMAKIFRAIFDEMLPKEDLVELEGRERLPSPQELQGKIILKGSYKVKFPTIIVTYIMSFHTNYIIAVTVLVYFL